MKSKIVMNSLRNRMVQAGAVLTLAGLLCGGVLASAQDDKSKEGEVAVGGKTILTIRFATEGMSIHDRAEAVQARLVTILADPNLKAADINAVPLGKNAAKIMVKDQLLVTVDAQTAKFNQAKPLQLAQTWVDHLRKVLPHVNVKPNPNSGEPPHNNESDKNNPPK